MYKIIFFTFLLLISVIDIQSQIKAPVLREISFNISIKNINGKPYYAKEKEQYVFDDVYEILIKEKEPDYTNANHLIGITSDFKEHGRFIKGYKNGLWRTTYKNKLVKTENWNNGLIFGKYEVYNTVGTLIYRTNFGKKGNGNYKDFYYKESILRQEGDYLNGKKEGEWCDYDQQGSLLKTTYYKKGIPFKK